MTKFRKLAAFGAGSGLKDLLTLLPGDVELVAIGDNDAARHGQSAGGVSIVPAAELARLDYDALVITAGAVDPVREQLIALGAAPDKILALCPSASATLVDQVNIDITRLNQGLGINLPAAGIATMYLRFESENLKASAWPVDFVRNQTFNLCAEQIASRGVTGSVAELGVFRGDQAHLISRLFPDRPFHLFDTFEGFAKADLGAEENSGFSGASLGDFANTSIDLVMSKLHRPERVVVHQGFFPATAEGVEDRFAFVSLDVDLHDPTAAGLEFFYQRLNSGGFIFVHDYNNGRYNGVRKAVEDFVATTSACTLPLPDFSGSIVVMKP
ncbi:TylF/MycF family methyltransferase [Novosphingobium sp. G106]|uniref:TylF/MycF family methyltransferase n=1 Tax=Novosphingobium sp. G106 TaxID=2849500 RepID=UPI001C2DD03D|nr:TylF/MycF family methyltransferase [Novosphingobium sp. G106]MBV1690030.1 TylF/MycF family methyltransferase [Novosphingobium sp. G106]